MLLICKHPAANHATFTSNQLDYAHYLGYKLWSWFKVRKLDIEKISVLSFLRHWVFRKFVILKLDIDYSFIVPCSLFIVFSSLGVSGIRHFNIGYSRGCVVL